MENIGIRDMSEAIDDLVEERLELKGGLKVMTRFMS